MANRSGNFLYYFTLSMTAIYALMGIYVMSTDSLEWMLPGNKKYVLGILLILYSFYRVYRITKLNKQMMNRDN